MRYILIIYLFLQISTITAQAAVFPEIPADPSTYTEKTANYNPEYEYCLNQVYAELPSLGTAPTDVTVPGFIGTEEEARAFSRYIYQYYDYTGRLEIYCRTVTSGSQEHNLCIAFDNPQEIYNMQMAVEQKLTDFSDTLTGLSDREKVIQINNWIASNAAYDETLQKTSCYSNIMEGSSTCNGYAKAFHALCSYSGITCENIKGYSEDMLHIWNRVHIGSSWEYVDVTWNSISHSEDWLLIPKEKIDEDHHT